MNVVPCRNEHCATPPPIPGRRVAVRPSRMNQNSRSVGPGFCYESLHSQMNVVPCRNEHYATAPPIPGGRVTVRPSRMNQKSISVGQSSVPNPFTAR
ncbi:hypothetical protein TNCT_643651 [Trichonephila clavata]|uniref:Uncharacterized protein n=1 Tax=Trichonephila clavata TaxID=2740835 RepID=A0A8X6FQ24_TRICU|nr:hypothetical protein TNCT_643641 [Trichonephila clavata]GFQ86381.1 hypothetical protein TNCT_643651 [Trichonephila clavata]